MQKVQIAKKSFGYDLSAATDRLPVQLQVSILSAFFGNEYAENWRKLLIDRDYYLGSTNSSELVRKRYSVGQPMGALSSWAMLAVTHHLIVQDCARVSGKVLPGT